MVLVEKGGIFMDAAEVGSASKLVGHGRGSVESAAGAWWNACLVGEHGGKPTCVEEGLDIFIDEVKEKCRER